MKSKCQDELELIFGSKKRDEVRRRDAWKRITDELNAQWPEKQQGLKIWRKVREYYQYAYVWLMPTSILCL